MFSDEKGQGAIEYILIIGGAVLIAAIVIAVLASTGRQAKADVNSSKGSYNSAVSDLNDQITN